MISHYVFRQAKVLDPFLKNNLVVIYAVQLFGATTNTLYFENMSTTTKIVDMLVHLGKTRDMDIDCQNMLGVGRICNNLTSLLFLVLSLLGKPNKSAHRLNVLFNLHSHIILRQ